jgi:8-oxo-dGTP pyrophosphatase MutT (NUDIX family)
MECLRDFCGLAFIGSYLWNLRQQVGAELVLMPGAMVVLQRDDGRVLLTKRADNGAWCLPAGAAEPGGSFAKTAIDELMEETGMSVAVDDLVPFGCLSEAATHTIHYPNGDVTHCFALCFLAREWRGEPRADGEESTEVRFEELDALPAPMDPPAVCALDLFRRFLASGSFQLG